MLEIAPFDPGDLDEIEMKPQQLAQLGAMPNWPDMIRSAASHGPAWTGRIGGRPVGCAGVALLWPGRSSAWCLLGAHVPKTAWVSIHRTVLRHLAAMRELGVERIEAETLRGFAEGERWLRMLGFQFEGVALRYGPTGQDYLRFARVSHG